LVQSQGTGVPQKEKEAKIKIWIFHINEPELGSLGFFIQQSELTAFARFGKFVKMATQTIYTTNTYDQQITITDVDGAALDITGGTAILTVRDYIDGIMATTTTTSHDTPASGITTLSFTAAETAAFTRGVFRYDIRYESSAGEKWTVITGMMNVSQRETRT
jgi:hypothetical protein